MIKLIKQRISYLCKKKGMSRQQLTEGLITLTHFSNILAGRYVLAKDLAEAMAERLETTPAYILKTDNWSDEIAKKISDLTEIAFSENIDDSIIPTLPLRADELSVEIAANIAAISILHRKGDQAKFKEIKEEYLDFYLDVFNDENIETLLPPLQKIFYFYKALIYSRDSKYENSLVYWNKILEIVEDDAEAWISVQLNRTIVFINMEIYDAALESADSVLFRIHKENRRQHLPQLHLIRCCIFDRIQLTQQAIVELAKAEENLMYVSDLAVRGRFLFSIRHNRIVISIECEWFDLATGEIEILQKDWEQNENISDEDVVRSIGHYKVMLFAGRKNWEDLSEELNKIQSLSVSSQHDLIINYYKGLMLYEQSQSEEAGKFLAKAEREIDPTLMSKQHIMRLYIMLGEIHEYGRKYKQAAEYYKMAYEIKK